jgi:serine/threonine-protein kinase RsbW
LDKRVTVDMKFSLALPREALSIPVIRRVLGDALRGLGVSEDCVADILLATCEACTNVVKHATATARYEVVTSIDDEKCVLKIIEMGRGPGADGFGEELGEEFGDGFADGCRDGLADGFAERTDRPDRPDWSAADAPAPGPKSEAESGRGIKIMRALVDDVTFDTTPGHGTIVYLQKRLTWRDEALLRRLEYDLVHSGR